jgi:hypothetical protein
MRGGRPPRIPRPTGAWSPLLAHATRKAHASAARVLLSRGGTCVGGGIREAEPEAGAGASGGG